MPWSWKSTLWRHYAYNTNKAFFDVDDIHKPFWVKKNNWIYKDNSNYYNKIIKIIDVLLEEWEDVVVAEPLKKEEQRKFFRDKYWDDLYFIHVKAPTEESRIKALIRRYAIDYPKRPEQEIIEYITSKMRYEYIKREKCIRNNKWLLTTRSWAYS